MQRLKDIAFERAIEDELIPVFVAGKLMGFRRKHNDRLLMFMLRHYGHDTDGKRTTINYFRANAGGEGASAEVGAATVRTVVTGRAGADGAGRARRDDRLAAEVAGFGGVTLDPQAEAAINAALEACAARARAAEAAMAAGGEAAADAVADDPAEPFVRLGEKGDPYRGALEPPVEVAEFTPFVEAEPDWRLAGADDPRAGVEEAVASVRRAKRRSNWGRDKAAG